MLKNEKLTNKIIAIAWAAAMLLGIIIAAWQGKNSLLPEATTTSDTAIKCGISALLALSVLLILQSALIIFKHRKLLMPQSYQAAGLALFAISALTGCFLSSAFFINSPIAAGIAAETICLEFIPFIIFIADSTRLQTPLKIIACGLALAGFIIQNILAVAGVSPLGSLPHLTNIINAICLVVSVYAIMRQRSESPFHYNMLAAVVLIFAACYLLEIVANNRHNIIMMIGITLFLAIMNLLVLQAAKEAVAKAAGEQKVFNQALVDYYTGFGSRLAFNDFYYNLSANYRGAVNIGVMVIDINNLKDTNDRYGHTAGDELILGAAECIKETFDDTAHFFRTGGDEFAIVIIGNTAAMETAMTRLDSAVIQYNARNVRQLSLARGICIDEAAPNDMKKLHIIYKAADDRMYNDKIEKHEQIKVQMIQETYLKKQMLQEQMIREKQFQEQMQRVAEAKQAEDMKKQREKTMADNGGSPQSMASNDSPPPTIGDIPYEAVEPLFPIQNTDYFWGYDKKQAKAIETAEQEVKQEAAQAEDEKEAQTTDIKEPQLQNTESNELEQNEFSQNEFTQPEDNGEPGEIDITSMLKSAARQETDDKKTTDNHQDDIANS